MRLKVCGITQPAQVEELQVLGADLAGFIFYKGSPRYVLNRMTTDQIRKAGSRLAKVGVFVNEPFESLMQAVDDCRLDMVQLHGDETPRFCERVSNYISVIKAFRLSENDPVEWMLKPYDDSCEMYLFDTLGAGYGGTGKKFDWNMLRSVRHEKLYFISGGVEPADAGALKTFAADPAASRLFAVDINSRFEHSPGIKDMDKIKQFTEALKNDMG